MVIQRRTNQTTSAFLRKEIITGKISIVVNAVDISKMNLGIKWK